MTKLRADSNSALAKLAERASHVPDFFGYLLLAFQQHEDLTTNELMKFLGIRQQLLSRLSLCRRPISDSPNFGEQVREIARFTETSPEVLLTVLRQVEALETLAGHNKIVPIELTRAEAAKLTHAGLLAAARDRDTRRHGRARKKSPPSGKK